MESLPLLFPILFVATTLVTLAFLYRAAGNNNYLLLIGSAWLIFQGALTVKGFYLDTTGVPPRFVLLILPPIILIITSFVLKPGNSFVDAFNPATLTLLHVVRIPVELILFALSAYKAVPLLMTFEGGNLDILSGLSAPFIYYFGYVKKTISRRLLITWNLVCLALLANIVTRAILSAPFTFQRFAFDQPNVALIHFPFSWLPAFVVPVVLFSHLAVIRRLYKSPTHPRQ